MEARFAMLISGLTVPELSILISTTLAELAAVKVRLNDE